MSDSPAALYARITDPSRRVEAVQLTDDVDWSDVAAWCGATLVFDHGEWVLQIPDESDATADDWVVKALDASAQVSVWMPGEFSFLYKRIPGDAA